MIISLVSLTSTNDFPQSTEKLLTMFKLSLVFFMLFFISCGKGNNSDNGYKEGPNGYEFNQFVAKFQSYAKSKKVNIDLSNITVQFDNSLLGTSRIGVCYEVSKRIGINKIYWDSWTKQKKTSAMEEVIFHELGHCALFRPHSTEFSNTNTSTKVPSSIMYPTFLNTDIYSLNQTYYINELFNPNIAGTITLLYKTPGSTTDGQALIANTVGLSVQIPYDDIEHLYCDQQF